MFLILSILIAALALFLTYYPISRLIDAPKYSKTHPIDIIINIVTYSFAGLLIVAGLRADKKFNLKDVVKFSFQYAISAYLYVLLIIGIAVLAAIWLSLSH